ncbi:MAG: MOSC domain-containing protein [Flavobacteriales bacterium]|nr:MOSC domain-containing protein [Flavobacteriia bacterium]NCP06091.1 MOSC domain-containing protein [Flavobacteriales bacterium]NCP52224.1 MOSC domain-containing protein [Flavobacteriales bacterium]NCP89360.1 MOSC domain-containing protein [Flavobacteriales bacterium]NCQ58213.1 MOSC domain-containing protein [Flavobacteriales bacterium]
MKIISTNLATPTTIIWNGKEETTGIYKNPTNKPIFIGKSDVKNDEVSDREHHGGFYKACYMFSAEQYPYWKNLYPNLEWNWGMFGENLTVSEFDETQVYLGDIYKVGEALVQISQYREPCYKLGYKFGTQTVLKQFIEHGFGGTYLSILEEGYVNVDDTFNLVKRPENRISVADLFRLIHSKDKDQDLLKIVTNSEAIPPKKQALLKSYIKD